MLVSPPTVRKIGKVKVEKSSESKEVSFLDKILTETRDSVVDSIKKNLNRGGPGPGLTRRQTISGILDLEKVRNAKG